MAPRAIGLGVTQITFIVVTSLASLLGDGAVSDFNFAFALLQIPLGIIGVPLGIVVLPSLSREAAVGREAAFASAADPGPPAADLRDGPDRRPDRGRARSLSSRSCSAAATSAPADLDLIAVDPRRRSSSAWPPTRMIAVLARAFYARQDTVTPVVAAVGAVAINMHARGRARRAVRPARASRSPSPSPPGSRPLVLLAILYRRLPHFELSGLGRVGVESVVGTVVAGGRRGRRPGVGRAARSGPSPGRLVLRRRGGHRQRRLRAVYARRLARLADPRTAVYRRGHGRRPPPPASGRDGPSTRRPGTVRRRRATRVVSPDQRLGPVKAVNGWTAHRLRRRRRRDRRPRIGAQVLVRRPRPMPWGFAYAPRGPVAGGWTPTPIGAFTDGRPRRPAGRGRTGQPPAHRPGDRGRRRRTTPTARCGDALRAAGWRPAPPIQPNATRIIDLRADEDALWGDLRKKWRQYVNKARTGGVTVVDADGDRLARVLPDLPRDRRPGRLPDPGRVRPTATSGTPSRRAGNARLLFAQAADGEPQATLFLVRCGPRVVEPYGGMTAAGADSRANYLLKWEAIRSSREAGATSYDLWGLATGGIAHFKTGLRWPRGALHRCLGPRARAARPARLRRGAARPGPLGAAARRRSRRDRQRGRLRGRRLNASATRRRPSSTDWDAADGRRARRARLPVAGLGRASCARPAGGRVSS